jgi:putative endonuclease
MAAKRPRAPTRAWFVYMLECAGGRVYTGITPDVAARFVKHCAGAGGAFTRSFPPLRVLAAKRCGTRSAALKAEYALKQLAPAAKRRWAGEWRWRATRIPRGSGRRRSGSASTGGPRVRNSRPR